MSRFKPEDLQKFSNPDRYSDSSFWEKVKSAAKEAGRALIVQALSLYYIAADSDTPAWAKTAIYGALAYFILPIDLIPDITPLMGYTDDLAALAAAWKAVSAYAKPEHSERAEAKWNEWFGA